jgi:hypothetical protein
LANCVSQTPVFHAGKEESNFMGLLEHGQIDLYGCLESCRCRSILKTADTFV